MNFEYDIFINYARLAENEDQPLKEWILKFCDFLSLVMQRFYNKKPNILLHDDFRTRTTLLGEDGQDIISKTAVFVMILSPEFLNSKEYIDELENIHQSTENSNNDSQNKPHRIFRVFTKPVKYSEQPDFLKSEPVYNFYDINRFNKKPVIFNLSEQEGPEQRFWSKIVDLAYDISGVMDQLELKEAKVQNRPNIFLAETTFDQFENRDRLKREFQHLGFHVLPLMPIPEEANEAKKAIEDNLRQSFISIHLLGGWYGEVIKNSKYSLIDFQIRAVKDFISDKHNKTKPEQIIWVPSDLRASDQRQALYIKRLKRDESQERTEIIETPFEVFKTALNTKIEEILNPVQKPLAKKNKLYVIYEKSGSEKIIKYLDIIRSKGYELIEPNSNNSEFDSLSEHINNLLIADAVLIYKGDSTMSWLNSKIRDLVKTPGHGKSEPFRAVEIISSQKTTDKSLLFLKNVPLNWDEEINTDVINHFLEQLNKK